MHSRRRTERQATRREAAGRRGEEFGGEPVAHRAEADLGAVEARQPLGRRVNTGGSCAKEVRKRLGRLVEVEVAWRARRRNAPEESSSCGGVALRRWTVRSKEAILDGALPGCAAKFFPNKNSVRHAAGTDWLFIYLYWLQGAQKVAKAPTRVADWQAQGKKEL